MCCHNISSENKNWRIVLEKKSDMHNVHTYPLNWNLENSLFSLMKRFILVMWWVKTRRTCALAHVPTMSVSFGEQSISPVPNNLYSIVTDITSGSMSHAAWQPESNHSARGCSGTKSTSLLDRWLQRMQTAGCSHTDGFQWANPPIGSTVLPVSGLGINLS